MVLRWQWAIPVEYDRNMCPKTLDLLKRAVHIDINPLLTDDDLQETITGINKVFLSI